MLETAIPTSWHRSINFGDQLAPFIVELITKKKAVYVDAKDGIKHIMPIGSLLDNAYLNDSIVWGCGFGQEETPVTTPYRVNAIRGKLSRQKYLSNGIECPEVYGDPALLLNRLFPVKTKKKFKLGIIPHIIDYKKALQDYWSLSDEVVIIDLRNDVESVIKLINQCEKTVSSSLHGLVVSHAYGIPSCWVEFSDNVIGAGFKFRDYFSVFNYEWAIYNPATPTDLRHKCVDMFNLNYWQPGSHEQLLDKLMNSFPEIV